MGTPEATPSERATEREFEAHNPDLRSLRQTLEYVIHAQDGEIGHVEDMLADDADWIIRYMAVGTRKWLPGRKVLTAMPWVHFVDWRESTVQVEPARDQIRGAPAYDPHAPVTREYESALWEHYGRKGYW